MRQARQCILALAACLAGMTACAPDNTGSTAPPLAGSNWLVEQLHSRNGLQAPAAGTQPGVQFVDTDRVAGSAGCNRYFGTWSASGSALTIDPAGTTRKACPPPVMQQEQAFLRALGRVARATPDGDALVLSDADDAVVMRLVPATPEPAVIPQQTGVETTYRCTDGDGQAFDVRTKTGPGELAVWLPARFGNRYAVLAQQAAASGVRYAGESIMVWTKGNEATVEIDGRAYTGCTA